MHPQYLPQTLCCVQVSWVTKTTSVLECSLDFYFCEQYDELCMTNTKIKIETRWPTDTPGVCSQWAQLRRR